MNCYDEIKKDIIRLLVETKPKEYACHIQFVTLIGMRLAKEHNAEINIVEIGCLLHDIGRGSEHAGESHEEAGVRIAKDLISSRISDEKIVGKILDCIKNHNAAETPSSLEEQIVMTADSASKVEFHTAFMLMCKKETTKERAEWGLKYLLKGYQKICFDNYRKDLTGFYEKTKAIYLQSLHPSMFYE